MSIRRIHFRRIAAHPRIKVRPLCERANVICSEANSSAEVEEVSCSFCLKRMAETKRWAAEMAAIRQEIAREAA